MANRSHHLDETAGVHLSLDEVVDAACRRAGLPLLPRATGNAGACIAPVEFGLKVLDEVDETTTTYTAMHDIVIRVAALFRADVLDDTMAETALDLALLAETAVHLFLEPPRFDVDDLANWAARRAAQRRALRS